MIGTKTEFYIEVKSKIKAGMRFCYNRGEITDYKIKTIGYKIIRFYFDTKEKDCTVGQETIKTIFF
jgi:hypothetical protein